MEEIKVIKSKFLRGVFDQNTYVLMSKKSAVIIDAGADIEDIKETIGNRKVLAVLMTHLHFDHFWNLEKYLEEFNCDVFVQEGFENKFEDGELNGSILVRKQIQKNISKNLIKYYAKKLILGEFEFEIILTPGHSADSVCILYNRNLFTGDTIFSDSIGRTDLKDSNNNQMIESLKVIREIDFDIAFPGHYESATKNEILKTISFYL